MTRQEIDKANGETGYKALSKLMTEKGDTSLMMKLEFLVQSEGANKAFRHFDKEPFPDDVKYLIKQSLFHLERVFQERIKRN